MYDEGLHTKYNGLHGPRVLHGASTGPARKTRVFSARTQPYSMIHAHAHQTFTLAMTQHCSWGVWTVCYRKPVSRPDYARKRPVGVMTEVAWQQINTRKCTREYVNTYRRRSRGKGRKSRGKDRKGDSRLTLVI